MIREQIERVAHTGFLGRRPSGQTQPGRVGYRGKWSLHESEGIYLGGTDRVAEIDCRRTPDECDQILCSREVGRGEGCRFVEGSPGWP